MSELKDALGRGTEVMFSGKPLMVEPLDFNDLCDIEEFSGINADDLDIGEFLQSAKNKRFFLWIVLRKCDPDLSQEERECGEYRMTEKEAGYLVKFGTTPEQFMLINTALGVSGLASGDEAGADELDKGSDAAGPKPRAVKRTPKPTG